MMSAEQTNTTVPTLERGGVGRKADGWSVQPVWAGVDRPDADSWTFGPRHEQLARRMAAAIMAGVVCTNPHIRTDVKGLTYVQYTSQVLARHANADLCRLGF